MPSKKHRPIVMNRNKKPEKTNSIFKKAALITVFLAFVEIIVLLVIHFKNANKETAVTGENVKETSKSPVQNAPKATVVMSPAERTTANKQIDTVAKKDTVEVKKPVVEIAEQPSQKTKKDSVAIQAVKFDETKAAKTLTQDKMFQILNKVRVEKLSGNNTAKCISVQIIGSTNAENGSKIANYLRKNGYIISGREVTAGSQKGIKINASETCIKLTIGDL